LNGGGACVSERRRERVHQCPKVFDVRESLVAEFCRRRDPGELVARHRLDEGPRPTRVVEHDRADVDESIKTRDAREHPALAGRAAVMIEVRSVNAALHGFAFQDFERVRRNHRRQGECARTHALTPAAMAGSRQHRRGGDLDPQGATPAVTNAWKF
jgi:hypothetical protein